MERYAFSALIAFWLSANAFSASNDVPSIDAEYPLPRLASGPPTTIISGPDGNYWFAENGTTFVGKITPSGAISEFNVGSGQIESLALGPDGNVWITEPFEKKIGLVNPAGTLLLEYPVLPIQEPHQIVANRYGVMYFSSRQSLKSSLGSITLGGYAHDWPLPGSDPVQLLSFLSTGIDDDIWLIESFEGKALSFNVHSFTFSQPLTLGPGAGVGSIMPGPDRAMWILESSVNKIIRVTSTSASTSEMTCPLAGAGLIQGVFPSDGKAWCYSFNSTRLRCWAIFSDSKVTEFALSSRALSICNGKNDDIWIGIGRNSAGFFSIGHHHLGTVHPRVRTSISSTGSFSSPNYTNFSFSTPESIATVGDKILSLCSRGLMRAFAWDAAGQAYVEVGRHPQGNTFHLGQGLLITSAVDVDLSSEGSTSGTPFDIEVYPGWNLVGIPALFDGNSTLSSHNLSEFNLCDRNRRVFTGSTKEAMIGATALSWDGHAYQNVTVFESGKAYWIRNATAQPLILTRVNTVTGGIVFLDARESGPGSTTSPSSTGGGGAPHADHPPAFPIDAAVVTPSACGSGSIAGLIVALSATVLWRSRRRAA